MMDAFWLPGQTITIRFVQRGVVRYAQPSKVVEDGPARTVLFMPMGTLVQLSRIDFETGVIDNLRAGRWHSTDVLRLIEPGAMHMISLMFQGGGGPFICWYVDFIDPVRRVDDGFVTWDQSLDIVVAPDLSWRWKDEDHFAHIQRLGWVSPEKAAAIRREGERVIEKIERRSRPFDEPWQSWRVDPSWREPVLAADWATVPA